MKVGDTVRVKKVRTVGEQFHNKIGEVVLESEHPDWSYAVRINGNDFMFRENELEEV